MSVHDDENVTVTVSLGRGGFAADITDFPGFPNASPRKLD